VTYVVLARISPGNRRQRQGCGKASECSTKSPRARRTRVPSKSAWPGSPWLSASHNTQFCLGAWRPLRPWAAAKYAKPTSRDPSRVTSKTNRAHAPATCAAFEATHLLHRVSPCTKAACTRNVDAGVALEQKGPQDDSYTTSSGNRSCGSKHPAMRLAFCAKLLHTPLRPPGCLRAPFGKQDMKDFSLS